MLVCVGTKHTHIFALALSVLIKYNYFIAQWLEKVKSTFVLTKETHNFQPQSRFIVHVIYQVNILSLSWGHSSNFMCDIITIVIIIEVGWGIGTAAYS